jgi:hypothetical protein
VVGEDFGEIIKPGQAGDQRLILVATNFFSLDRLKGQKLTFFCPVFETESGFGTIKWGSELRCGVELGSQN